MLIEKRRHKTYPKMTHSIKVLVEVLVDIPLLHIEVLQWEDRLKLVRMKFAEEGGETPVFIHVFAAFERVSELRAFVEVFGAKELANTEPPLHDIKFSSKDKRFLYQQVLHYLLQQKTGKKRYQHLVLLPDFLRPYEKELHKRKFTDALFYGARMLSRLI